MKNLKGCGDLKLGGSAIAHQIGKQICDRHRTIGAIARDILQ
ncbi:hypothetical protein [aff. Roholtiella sp. LEGE 12411]|nr:hypothetical protein [aff. Roholtiella sp. LEGE 12411]